MNTFRKTALSLLAGMGLAASLPAAAYETMSLTPLLRDVVAAQPGKEAIVPFMIQRDTNSDGAPDVLCGMAGVQPQHLYP